MDNKEPSIPLELAKFAIAILASSKSSVKITPVVSDLDLQTKTSKFLGCPYWPLSVDSYPKDREGNNMKMIAQINLSEVHAEVHSLEHFPATGILQFYIPAKDSRKQYWGLCFDNDGKSFSDVAVIYHENTELPDLLTQDLKDLHSLDSNDEFPVFEHCKLYFSNKYEFCPLVDEYHSQHFYEDLTLSDEEEEIFHESDEFSSCGAKMNGYAYFTQYDIRDGKCNEDNPWILLLQIDSMEDENGKDISMWGDCGVANWFIRKNDLINKDFSKVLYSWDCC